MGKTYSVRLDDRAVEYLTTCCTVWGCTPTAAIRHMILNQDPNYIDPPTPRRPKPAAPRVPGRGRGRPAMPPPPEGFRSWKSFNAFHAQHNTPTPLPVASNPPHPSSDLQSVLDQLE